MPAISNQAPVEGAYCSLADLIGLRFAAGKLDLGQRKRALSLLSGPNKTNFRGRGIDFEEVRAYQAGDDIRTIDWRITARTGEAHTKLFREERERQVLIAVDQRNSMFFGSRHCCKSVLAAHIAALLSWAALQRGDRVGGLVFSEAEHHEIRPRRSRRSVLALLSAVSELNAGLPLEASGDEVRFAGMLVDLRRIRKFPDRSLHQLARHLEITAIHCSDPLEQSLPVAGRYTVTNGEQRTRLYTGDRALREQFAARFQDQFDSLQAAYSRLGIPVITASTDQSPQDLLQRYYAGGSGARR